MAVKPILLLGNPDLYRVRAEIRESELPVIRDVVTDLHDTLTAFRDIYGCGRAIAAPQIGVFKRLVSIHIGEPTVFLNPRLVDLSNDRLLLWDDCMSFPELLVRVERHKTCMIRYCDLDWNDQEMPLKGDMSELLQHECDHLDGILATRRALDDRSIALKRTLQRSG